MSRRLAREVALRALFQLDGGDGDVDAALRYNADELDLPGHYRPFAERLVRGALANREQIDALLGRLSVGWTVERMPRVDRNILRMGAYEILHEEETPASVVINEAVELAKIYGDVESGRFINGILGSLVRSRSRSVTP